MNPWGAPPLTDLQLMVPLKMLVVAKGPPLGSLEIFSPHRGKKISFLLVGCLIKKHGDCEFSTHLQVHNSNTPSFGKGGSLAALLGTISWRSVFNASWWGSPALPFCVCSPAFLRAACSLRCCSLSS